MKSIKTSENFSFWGRPLRNSLIHSRLRSSWLFSLTGPGESLLTSGAGRRKQPQGPSGPAAVNQRVARTPAGGPEIATAYGRRNLVLSAKIPYRALCEGFFIKSGPKNIPKTQKWPNKKLLAG